MKQKTEEAGVNVQYQINEKVKTGTCAAMLYKDHRYILRIEQLKLYWGEEEGENEKPEIGEEHYTLRTAFFFFFNLFEKQ